MPDLSTFYSNLKSGDLAYTLSSRLIFRVGFNMPGAPPDELQTFIVRSVSVPNLSTNDGHDVISNARGKYVFPKNTGYTPADNTLKVTFLETEFPFIEKYIEPWYKKCASIGYRIHRDNSLHIDVYTTNINAGQKIVVSYDVNGIYPEFLDMPELDHTRTDLKLRSVVFAFNEMIPILNNEIENQSSQSKIAPEKASSGKNKPKSDFQKWVDDQEQRRKSLRDTEDIRSRSTPTPEERAQMSQPKDVDVRRLKPPPARQPRRIPEAPVVAI